MLSKRAIGIAADKGLRKQIAAGLKAAGAAADTFAAPSEVPKGSEADLIVVHLAGHRDRKLLDALKARVKNDVPIVVVIPSAALDETVSLMQVRGVASVLTANELDNSGLANVAARLLFGDIFGIEKLVPWGVRVHAVLVGDYEEKSIAIKEISEFAEQVGVRRKYRELIEQCLDEMLMNALYDAPIDADGKPKFQSVPIRERITHRADEKVLIEYACDGKSFAMAVRDAFGSLKRDTVVWYLDKCLHAPEQIDRKEGGAGLGLYFIANSSTQFFVNLHASVATEAAVRFDLTAPKVQLEGFGIFDEKADAAAPSASRDAPVRAGAPKGLLAALFASLALILVLIGMVAYPMFAPVPRGDVLATTDPSGAVVEVDGRAVGEAPVEITDLEAGARYIVSAQKQGFREALAIVTPSEGAVEEVHLGLEREGARVLLDSDPPGADVSIGDRVRGRTPFEIDLPAGTEHEVRFERQGYAPVVETVRVPTDGSGEVKAAMELAPGFAALAIDTSPEGASVRIGGVALDGETTPIDEYLLRPGESHEIEIELDGYAPVIREVVVDEGERKALEIGLQRGARLTVAASLPRVRVSVDDLPCRGLGGFRDCPAPAGNYRVRVASDEPFIRDSFDVSVGGEDVSRSVHIGVVATESERYVLDLEEEDAPPGIRRAGLRAGTRTVTIVDTESDERREEAVQVSSGEVTVLSWE